MSEAYIHGYSPEEQERLVNQARILAPNVFRGWDLSDAGNLLEIGCAVGAELKLLSEYWPHLKLTGLDRSTSQLEGARWVLAEEIRDSQIELVEGDAGRMPFADNSFDRVITIWMLEHANDPVAVLREALRVLKPDGRLICTEVDNQTFGFDPPVPIISEWWERFNRFQKKAGGDPFVGQQLQAYVESLGARDIQARVEPIISSRREPHRRRELLDYLKDLLLSGAENLVREGYVNADRCDALRHAFAELRDRPEVEFQYFAVRLTCLPPA